MYVKSDAMLVSLSVCRFVRVSSQKLDSEKKELFKKKAREREARS